MSTEVNGDRGSVTPTPQQQQHLNGNGNTKAEPITRRKIKVEITSDAICEFSLFATSRGYLSQI